MSAVERDKFLGDTGYLEVKRTSERPSGARPIAVIKPISVSKRPTSPAAELFTRETLVPGSQSRADESAEPAVRLRRSLPPKF